MEQIAGVLKQAQVGVPVAEVIRKAGISEQTFYRWKAKYAGLEAVVIEVGQSLKGYDVVHTLNKLKLERGVPRGCSVTTAASSQSCHGPVGLSEQREDRLLNAWQAD